MNVPWLSRNRYNQVKVGTNEKLLAGWMKDRCPCKYLWQTIRHDNLNLAADLSCNRCRRLQ